MKCPSCNKFAAYNTDNEPEVNVEVESELIVETEDQPDGAVATSKENPDLAVATVSGDARIVLTAECCGDELKEANFEMDGIEVEVARAEGCECDLTELSVEVDSQEITTRAESTAEKRKKDGTVVVKQIAPRYQKSFYGVQFNVTVSCACGKSKETAEFQDECQASAMDELV